MTACVKIETLRQFARVEEDVDDVMLELMAESATGLIETRLRRPVIGDVNAGAVAATVDEVPKDIQVACCMLMVRLGFAWGGWRRFCKECVLLLAVSCGLFAALSLLKRFYAGTGMFVFHNA